MSHDAGLLLAAVIVLLAGVLKGSIGFGAPLVAVPLLATLVDTRTAIVLISLPLLVANAGVLLTRPVDRQAIRRFVPLLVTLIPMTFLGGLLLARVNIATLTVVVGIVTIAFVGITASGFQPVIPSRLERPISALVGLVAGVLNGATSAPGPIFSLYLSGLRLGKRDFVYGITMLLAVGNVAQVFTYWQQGLLVGNLLLASATLVPAILLGQVAGLRIQDRLDPLAFRRVVLMVVALAGLNLLARGVGAAVVCDALRKWRLALADWAGHVVTRRTLTAGDLTEIRALGALCNQTDGLNLKLNWDLMQARSPEVVSDFCAYAGDELIGYVALDGDDEELELTGMVHPTHRRRGIARALVAAAREECQRRGTERLLLVCERSSASGRAFVAVIGAHFSFAEYHMELAATTGQVVPASDVQLRRAEHDDIPLVAEMQARCWDNSDPVPETQVQQMARRFDEPGSRYYRAFVRGEAVGQIGVLFEENQLYIRGVGILPEQRRRGYGRQMLAATVATLIAEGQTHFSLDVATENERALELYRSCGFEETNVYEYHTLPLA